jgi:transcriptional regulator with XRE-family HTH domain
MCNALGQRFRDVIRYLRDRELVYNEAQLASKMGISRQFLSDMKNGRKEITEQTVLKLCEVFPVISSEWLISGVGSMVVEPAVHPPVVESVSIPGDAWEVIRLQAASLEKKDTQVDRLLDIIEGQLGVVPGGHKKNNRSSGGAGGSASGADHFAS